MIADGRVKNIQLSISDVGESSAENAGRLTEDMFTCQLWLFGK